MWPTVIELPVIGIPINTYGIAIMIGFLLAVYIWLRRVKAAGFDVDFALDVSIVAMLTGLLGGKIASIITNYSAYSNELQIFNVFDGGLSPLGSLLGLLPLAIFLYRTRGKEVSIADRLKSLSIWTLVCVIIGMRAIYIIQYHDEYNLNLFRKWQAGFALYGGLILGMISGIIFARMKKQPVLKLLDIAGPSVLLGLSVGRLGCFATGCCFGKTCDLPWAVSFPRGTDTNITPVFQKQVSDGLVDSSATHTLPVHPTQLYEVIACIIGFFALSYILKKKKLFDGFVILMTGIYYSVWRFINEFLRDDPERLHGEIMGITWPQQVSIVMFLFCAVMLIYYWKKSRRVPVDEVKT